MSIFGFSWKINKNVFNGKVFCISHVEVMFEAFLGKAFCFDQEELIVFKSGENLKASVNLYELSS